MIGTDATSGKPIGDEESFAHVWQLFGYSIIPLGSVQLRKVNEYYDHC